MMRIGALAALAVVATLLAPRTALATVSCTPSTLAALDLGTPSPFDASDTDIQQSFTVSCQMTRGDLTGATGSSHTLYLCIGYNNGSAGASAGGNRQLTNGSANANYDLYTTNSYSGTHWGNRAGAPTGLLIQRSLTFTKPSGQATVVVGPQTTTAIQVYARLFGSQLTLAPGTYASGLTQTVEAFLDTAPPANCGAGGTTASTTNTPHSVTVNYQKECRVGTVSTLDFGSAGFLTSNLDSSTSLAVTCTSTTPFRVGLGAGLGAGATTTNRKMTRTSAPFSTIDYSLYRDNNPALNWGNDTSTGSDTQNGSGSGSAATYTIYGRVPPQSTPQPGDYQDTVVLSVVF
jgi:spore coat protein U-like protein